MRRICRWLIRFNPTTIGFAHATAPEADPADRSEGKSYRCGRTRTPRAGWPLPGAPQWGVRLRSHVYKPGGTRDPQSYGQPAVEDRGGAEDSPEPAREAYGTLDRLARAGSVSPRR